jgi:hypothetical protein
LSDKDFKVKNKLVIAGLTNSSGVLLVEGHTVDSHTNLATQFGGTGTTTSPTSGQFLYSSGGTTYAPTDLSSVVPVNLYQDSMPSSASNGQIWVDSNASAVTISQYLAPTIGSTQIPSNTTVSTISGLTLSSPTLTGTPIAPTASSGANSNQIANTAFVSAAITSLLGNVSSTELSYLDGVTSAVQTQINTKASTGKAIAMAIVFGG